MLSEAMKAKNWKLQICQKPLCLHLAITLSNIENARKSFADDLRQSMLDVRSEKLTFLD